MNVAKLFAINILIAVVFINLVGCVDFKERVVAVQAICDTDTDCMKWDAYFDQLGEKATADDVVKLKAYCGDKADCLNHYLTQVDPFMDMPVHEALAQAIEVKEECDADPEDKLDLQYCE